jgi:hypothetical protein
VVKHFLSKHEALSLIPSTEKTRTHTHTHTNYFIPLFQLLGKMRYDLVIKVIEHLFSPEILDVCPSVWNVFPLALFHHLGLRSNVSPQRNDL